MGFFNHLFKAKTTDRFDYAAIAVDMHSHLIPGIDDGSKSLEETKALLLKFVDLGYKKVITTPHIMQDFYKNDRDNIYRGRDEVLALIAKENIPIEFEAAAEHFYDDAFMERIKRKEVLTFGNQFCLLEFGFHHQPSFEDAMFFNLLSAGYQPILAHFERYHYFHGSIEKAFEYREKGISIQLNINSLSGNYGPDVKKQAVKLIQADAVDFIASDCHRMSHLDMMESLQGNELLQKLNLKQLKNKVLL